MNFITSVDLCIYNMIFRVEFSTYKFYYDMKDRIQSFNHLYLYYFIRIDYY
jgi:hypothetical protein